jgi:hypothetical protein
LRKIKSLGMGVRTEKTREGGREEEKKLITKEKEKV